VSNVSPSYHNGFARHAGESAHPELWEGLVGAWLPVLGPTGSTLRDVSGFQNHGTLTDMVPGTDWILGQNPWLPGHALVFDGVEHHIALPDISGLFAVSGTLLCWLRKNVNSEESGMNSLANVAGPDEHYGWSDGNLYMNTFRTVRENLGDNSGFDKTQWHQLAITTDGADYKLYQNTTEFASTAAEATVTMTTAPKFGESRSTYMFNGDVALWFLFNRALRSRAIADRYIDPLAMFRRRGAAGFVVPAAAGAVPYQPWSQRSPILSQ